MNQDPPTHWVLLLSCDIVFEYISCSEIHPSFWKFQTGCGSVQWTIKTHPTQCSVPYSGYFIKLLPYQWYFLYFPIFYFTNACWYQSESIRSTEPWQLTGQNGQGLIRRFRKDWYISIKIVYFHLKSYGLFLYSKSSSSLITATQIFHFTTLWCHSRHPLSCHNG